MQRFHCLYQSWHVAITPGGAPPTAPAHSGQETLSSRKHRGIAALVHEVPQVLGLAVHFRKGGTFLGNFPPALQHQLKPASW